MTDSAPSQEEIKRCMKLFYRYRGEWVWHMTDAEFAIAKTELERRVAAKNAANSEAK